MFVARFVLTVLVLGGTAFPPVSSAQAACPPGYVQTSVAGERDDPKYRGQFKCMRAGLVSCANGKSCPAGMRCKVGGGCVGPPQTGEICKNGRPCPTGYRCGARACYDPRTTYICGVAHCGIGWRYLPGQRCYRCAAQRGR